MHLLLRELELEDPTKVSYRAGGKQFLRLLNTQTSHPDHPDQTAQTNTQTAQTKTQPAQPAPPSPRPRPGQPDRGQQLARWRRKKNWGSIR